MLAQLFDSSLYTSSGRLLFTSSFDCLHFLSCTNCSSNSRSFCCWVTKEIKIPNNKKRNGEQNEKLNSPQKRKKSGWTRSPSTADWIENYVGGLERDGGGVQQGVENLAVMMSKCTTGASPAVECCRRFGRGTDGRWLLLLAVIPFCCWRLLLLFNYTTSQPLPRVRECIGIAVVSFPNEIGERKKERKKEREKKRWQSNLP